MADPPDTPIDDIARIDEAEWLGETGWIDAMFEPTPPSQVLEPRPGGDSPPAPLDSINGPRAIPARPRREETIPYPLIGPDLMGVVVGVECLRARLAAGVFLSLIAETRANIRTLVGRIRLVAWRDGPRPSLALAADALEAAQQVLPGAPDFDAIAVLNRAWIALSVASRALTAPDPAWASAARAHLAWIVSGGPPGSTGRAP